jgi:uncharacterized membrane protein YhiD involved in acid resistance
VNLRDGNAARAGSTVRLIDRLSFVSIHGKTDLFMNAAYSPRRAASAVLQILIGLALAISLVVAADAQVTPTGGSTDKPPEFAQVDSSTVPGPEPEVQLVHLVHAMQRLPLAAGLAAVLALRPRRRGTPRRQVHVVQTQIILSLVGAVVMLVVGSSLARAFGIVGAAGLVRYRSKISDPKDAGVMLSTLAIGLATGVGLWMIATFATVFFLAVLWVIESFEPKVKQQFELTVKAKDPSAVRGKVEELLKAHRLEFDLRSSTKDEMSFEVRKPLDKKTDKLSETIFKLDPENITGVEWDEKKEKS